MSVSLPLGWGRAGSGGGLLVLVLVCVDDLVLVLVVLVLVVGLGLGDGERLDHAGQAAQARAPSPRAVRPGRRPRRGRWPAARGPPRAAGRPQPRGEQLAGLRAGVAAQLVGLDLGLREVVRRPLAQAARPAVGLLQPALRRSLARSSSSLGLRGQPLRLARDLLAVALGVLLPGPAWPRPRRADGRARPRARPRGRPGRPAASAIIFSAGAGVLQVAGGGVVRLLLGARHLCGRRPAAPRRCASPRRAARRPRPPGPRRACRPRSAAAPARARPRRAAGQLGASPSASACACARCSRRPPRRWPGCARRPRPAARVAAARSARARRNRSAALAQLEEPLGNGLTGHLGLVTGGVARPAAASQPDSRWSASRRLSVRTRCLGAGRGDQSDVVSAEARVSDACSARPRRGGAPRPAAAATSRPRCDAAPPRAPRAGHPSGTARSRRAWSPSAAQPPASLRTSVSCRLALVSAAVRTRFARSSASRRARRRAAAPGPGSRPPVRRSAAARRHHQKADRRGRRDRTGRRGVRSLGPGAVTTHALIVSDVAR